MSRDDTLDAIAAELLAEAADGCCMNDSWRGRPCPYHSGYEDGIDIFIENLSRRGFVVVRVDGDGIRHGDTLHEVWPTGFPEDNFWRVRSSVSSQPAQLCPHGNAVLPPDSGYVCAGCLLGWPAAITQPEGDAK